MPTKEHGKKSTNKEVAVVFLLLDILLAFSISSIPVEPDQGMVHVETIEAYYYDTEGDVISYPVTLTGERTGSSELRNFDLTSMLDTKGAFISSLQVSHVSGEYLISGSGYKWEFPGLDVGEGLSPTVWFEEPLSFTPDLSASRVMTPSRLAYPGGTQTINFSVTPLEAEFTGEIRVISLSVSMVEDDNIKSSALSVTWPSMSEGGEITHLSQTDEYVGCDITDPKIGVTYTLIVTIDIDLKDWIKAVEYKPRAYVRDRIYLPSFKTSYGNSIISETQAGTWTWESTGQHTWLFWNSIQKEVDFMAHSRAIQPIGATVDINPVTLNLKSKDKYFICYIELPIGHNAKDIDASSISLTELNDESLETPLRIISPFGIGDYDKDDITDLLVRFDMQALLRLLEVGKAKLTVEGYLNDVTPFRDTVIIRVFSNFNIF